jgi:hypothetical protein
MSKFRTYLDQYLECNKSLTIMCDNCIFFTYDECHKNSPTIIVFRDAVESFWPSVEPENFCGEWVGTDDK